MLEFKIYKFDFKCDCCGEETCMGIIGFTKLVPNICDLCLINGFDGEEQFIEDDKARQTSTVKSEQNNSNDTTL